MRTGTAGISRPGNLKDYEWALERAVGALCTVEPEKVKGDVETIGGIHVGALITYGVMVVEVEKCRDAQAVLVELGGGVPTPTPIPGRGGEVEDDVDPGYSDILLAEAGDDVEFISSQPGGEEPAAERPASTAVPPTDHNHEIVSLAISHRPKKDKSGRTFRQLYELGGSSVVTRRNGDSRTDMIADSASVPGVTDELVFHGYAFRHPELGLCLTARFDEFDTAREGPTEPSPPPPRSRGTPTRGGTRVDAGDVAERWDKVIKGITKLKDDTDKKSLPMHRRQVNTMRNLGRGILSPEQISRNVAKAEKDVQEALDDLKVYNEFLEKTAVWKSAGKTKFTDREFHYYDTEKKGLGGHFCQWFLIVNKFYGKMTIKELTERRLRHLGHH